MSDPFQPQRKILPRVFNDIGNDIDRTFKAILDRYYRKAVMFNGYNAQVTPTDAATYYFGLTNRTPAGTEQNFRIYPPVSGVIKRVKLKFEQTAGSAELSSIYFRLNNVTDTLISSAVVNDAAVTTAFNYSLSIAIKDTEYFAIKWVTPTWATDPANVRLSWVIYMEL